MPLRAAWPVLAMKLEEDSRNINHNRLAGVARSCACGGAKTKSDNTRTLNFGNSFSANLSGDSL
jgi:hypothetical protein